MQRTLQTIGAFWAAGALVMLIFSTMLEPTRTYIEHLDIMPYLIRWLVIIAPAPILLWLSERMATPAAHH
jgi:hypothetical protein